MGLLLDGSATGRRVSIVELGSQYCHTPLIVAYRRLAAYQGVQSAGPWRTVVARASVLVVVAIMAKELPC